jgi:hypothetical protein
MIKWVALCVIASMLGPSSALGREASPPHSREGKVKIKSDCIARSVPITDHGHRWNIDATNNCGGRGWSCDFRVTLRTNNGLTTQGACSGFVPLNAHGLRVCSVYDSTKTWIAVTSNTYQCHY